MATAHEIAADVLQAFSANVIARRSPMTYGQYALAIGKMPSRYGLAIGKAMHAIGALCVIRQVPIAPLYWVQREDGGHRGIFEADPIERTLIVDSGDVDDLYVAAREHRYTSDEFSGILGALNKSLASGNINQWSPHEIWHLALTKKPDGCELTYYERALKAYRAEIAQMRSARAQQR